MVAQGCAHAVMLEPPGLRFGIEDRYQSDDKAINITCLVYVFSEDYLGSHEAP